MKSAFMIVGLVISLSASAAPKKEAGGCYAYGKSYAEDESDCDGRVCQHDGSWQGVVKSGLCDVTDDQGDGRDPASVKKHKKHSKKKKSHK
jgi:hypothetical protein